VTADTASTPRIDPDTLPGRPCSVAAALELVGDRWSLLIVREVLLGNGRFSQIARNTGAPRDRLAARLKALVEAGILARHAYQESPRREEYRATDSGRDLSRVTQSLLEWGDRWAVISPPVRLTHAGHALSTEVVCGTCGEPVRREDVSRQHVLPGWDNAGRVPD
jgi:DNA-binding HxlR family transcriptional regulator